MASTFFALLLALATPISIPVESGLYYFQNTSTVRIEGRATSFSRSGSRLVSTVTVGIKSSKINAQILGKTSEHVVPMVTTFYYRLAAGNEAVGGSAGDLVLVKMEVKGNRRQFEMGAAGMGRASAGISLRSQVEFRKKQIEQQLYELTTPEPLERGEYAFYLFRGYDLPGFIYDFTVR